MLALSNRLLRPPLPLLAIYAFGTLLWIGFANRIAPNLIAAAYNERSLSLLNWFFRSHRSLPLKHYLDRWSVIAAAVSIAVVLHLVIDLFIGHISRRHRLAYTPTAFVPIANC